nr:hypothetical protein [Helicobacter suis]
MPRFPHLISKQMSKLFNVFSQAIEQYHYWGVQGAFLSQGKTCPILRSP